MGKFLNFFTVGLLIGAAVLYYIYREQQFTQDLNQLKSELAEIRASSVAEESSRDPTVSPSAVRHADLQRSITESRKNAITLAITHTADAVVGINVVQVREYENPLFIRDPIFRMLFDERYQPPTVTRRVQNLGSGFIVSPDGYIVTNEHVVHDATEIVITTTAGSQYDASIIGSDYLLDMALLKIEGTNLQCLSWGNSDSVVVGEWAIAIGNPYGLFDVNDQPSVSVGVISAIHRDFERGSDGRIYSDMIQTDAAINRGNSGGPLINANGEAVGMNTLIFSESGGSIGIGFAIPSNRIVAAIDDLLKGGINRNYWIGIRATDMTGILYRLHGLERNRGAVVTNVEADSPAEKAGIQPTDVILEIDGYPVNGAQAAKDYLINNDLRVGDQLDFTISRRGQVFHVLITLAPLPQETGRTTG